VARLLLSHTSNLTYRGLATSYQEEQPIARVVRFHETGGPEVLRIEEIVGAHRYMESNQQFGKIVVTV
jgi:hypothetical protein